MIQEVSGLLRQMRCVLPSGCAQFSRAIGRSQPPLGACGRLNQGSLGAQEYKNQNQIIFTVKRELIGLYN